MTRSTRISRQLTGLRRSLYGWYATIKTNRDNARGSAKERTVACAHIRATKHRIERLTREQSNLEA